MGRVTKKEPDETGQTGQSSVTLGEPYLNEGALTEAPHLRTKGPDAGMYVCICNAVTEDDVRSCIASGACSPREVKAACGMKPGCGTCTKRLYALISEYRTASELVDAITGGPASPVMPAELTEPMPPPCVRQGPVPVAGTTLPVRTYADPFESADTFERGSASATAA